MAKLVSLFTVSYGKLTNARRLAVFHVGGNKLGAQTHYLSGVNMKKNKKKICTVDIEILMKSAV
jgi:hypothetical protein